ncbi:MAG: hypothetical protein LW832_01825 [Parachlamydia sp.]|jgi:hypothetical protein|nr:hypothetical protein [Parachlamydia sp.]
MSINLPSDAWNVISNYVKGDEPTDFVRSQFQAYGHSFAPLASTNKQLNALHADELSTLGKTHHLMNKYSQFQTKYEEIIEKNNNGIGRLKWHEDAALKEGCPVLKAALLSGSSSKSALPFDEQTEDDIRDIVKLIPESMNNIHSMTKFKEILAGGEALFYSDNTKTRQLKKPQENKTTGKFKLTKGKTIIGSEDFNVLTLSCLNPKISKELISYLIKNGANPDQKILAGDYKPFNTSVEAYVLRVISDGDPRRQEIANLFKEYKFKKVEVLMCGTQDSRTVLKPDMWKIILNNYMGLKNN